MTTLDWLLEPTNPSVQYLALRHLLGRCEDDADVRQARAAIPHSPIVRRIFAKQSPEGHWGDPAAPYLPKYKATYWTLMLLGYLGLTRDDDRARRAAECVFAFQTAEGGFSERGEEAARREYAYATEWSKRLADGAWILESAPQGRMQTNLEKQGQPSKWITLMALWALGPG